MKILMVSIFSQHFFNWAAQLKNAGHEVYWLDVFDSNTKVKQIDFVHQIVGWRYKWDYPGRYFVKRKFPKLTAFINRINQRKLAMVFEEKLREIKPDVVHSFVMYLAGVPIFEVMQKFSHIKWIYSAWGSDMFFYQNQPGHLEGMKRALPRVDFMFADCFRDYHIAKKHGFQGKFLGVFPGGGGFNFVASDAYMKPFLERNIILIKGYQGKHGRCITALKAILQLRQDLKAYKIVVFGAAAEVMDFVQGSGLNTWSNFSILGQIPNNEVLKLLGKAVVYIGNSKSDGIPNTLLEAIIMGVFPIQSNPGGATAELIEHGKNGLLIRDPEDSKEIATLIKKAVQNPLFLKQAVAYNTPHVRPKLERKFIRNQVLEKYKFVEENLKK